MQPGLKRFLASLIPEQARAIRRLHFASWWKNFALRQSTISLLKGLKHAEVNIWATHYELGNINPDSISLLEKQRFSELDIWGIFYTMGDKVLNPLQCLQSFTRNGGLEWLKSLGLLSIRFNLGVTNGPPIIGDHKDIILEWIARAENEIMSDKPITRANERMSHLGIWKSPFPT